MDRSDRYPLDVTIHARDFRRQLRIEGDDETPLTFAIERGGGWRSAAAPL